MYKFNGELEFKHSNKGNELLLTFTLGCNILIDCDTTIVISDSIDKNVNCINIRNSFNKIQYNIFTIMKSFSSDNYLKLIELMKHNYIDREMSIEDWTKLIIDVLIQTVTSVQRNIDPFRIVKLTENDTSGFIMTPNKITNMNIDTTKIKNDDTIIEILLPFFEYNKFDNKSLSNMFIGKLNRQVSPCRVGTNESLLHHHLNLFQIYQLYSHELMRY